nr:hypothetical protein [Tanacetum cinerariifolium]
MLTKEIKKSKAYKAFIDYFTGVIPPKKTRGLRLKNKKKQAADTMQAIKASKMVSRSLPHTRGSSKGAGVLDEVKGSSEAKVDSAIDWGSKNESDYSEEDRVDNKLNDYLLIKKKRSKMMTMLIEALILKRLMIKMRMMNDAAKADANKTEEVKGADTQARIEVAKVDQAKDTNCTDVEIHSLLDIQIQKEVPQIQSPTLLNVPVSVIPKQPVPDLSLALTSKTHVLTVHPPRLPVTAISSVQHQLAPIPTPPNSTNNNFTILTMIRSQVPSVVNEYLGSSLGDSLQKAYEKHHAYKALYDALIKSLFVDEYDMDQAAGAMGESALFKRKHDDQDEDPTAGSDQGKDKKRPRKNTQPSKKSFASKESTKGNTPPKTSKSGKSHPRTPLKVILLLKLLNLENIVDEMGNTDEQPNGEAVPNTDNALKNDWFKQPLRPPTLDLEWNKCQVIDDQLEKTWFNDLVSAQKDPLIFDELIATPIDFSEFTMNHLKLYKITKVDLVGPFYNLLKGTCQSSIELE